MANRACIAFAAMAVLGPGSPVPSREGALPTTNGAPVPSAIVPQETGVLLLPPLDTEPWADHVLRQRQFSVRRREQYELISRRFKVYSEALAARAADQDPKIDLKNVTERTAANLDALARRSGARWVVSLEVQEVAGDPTPQPGAGAFRSHCRVKMLVWDAAAPGWLINGPYVGHDKGANSSPILSFKESIDEATRGALGQLIGEYAANVPVAPVGKVADYLAGQTEPFVGDPQQPFAGLKTH